MSVLEYEREVKGSHLSTLDSSARCASLRDVDGSAFALARPSTKAHFNA